MQSLPPDAARLSQVLHLPKKNHTEENFPDLEVPSLTLQMKQAEQARACASSSDKYISDSQACPSTSFQLGTCSAGGPGEARGQQGSPSSSPGVTDA